MNVSYTHIFIQTHSGKYTVYNQYIFVDLKKEVNVIYVIQELLIMIPT